MKYIYFILIIVIGLNGNLYSWERSYSRGRRDVVISPEFIYPVGEYAEISDPGYGGIFSYFFDSSSTALEFGFFYLPGIDELETEGRSLEHSYIGTAAFKHGWPFRPFRHFIITPYLSAGAAYINLKYTTRSVLLPEDEEYDENGVDPMLSASVSFDWRLPGDIILGLNAGYGILVEEKKEFQFLKTGINLGVRF
ncbi:MAG TPA: hypothetical protein PK358_17895 [Spirochaetota bacterium]|nr:hypothetical protein [Spirochaetota bacterium]